MTRLEALRVLLSRHRPTKDDERIGAKVKFTGTTEKVKLQATDVEGRSLGTHVATECVETYRGTF